jgi:hypothetical protein
MEIAYAEPEPIEHNCDRTRMRSNQHHHALPAIIAMLGVMSRPDVELAQVLGCPA